MDGRLSEKSSTRPKTMSRSGPGNWKMAARASRTSKAGARDEDGIRVGIKTYVGGLRMRMEDLPPLRVEAKGLRGYMVGKGEPAASVSAEPFELFGALGGRRTEDQIRSYDWEGDPTPYLHRWVSGGAFEWSDAPVTE